MAMGEAMKEFLQRADTLAAARHRHEMTLDRAFVARLAADLRVVSALFTMLETETSKVVAARKAGEASDGE